MSLSGCSGTMSSSSPLHIPDINIADLAASDDDPHHQSPGFASQSGLAIPFVGSYSIGSFFSSSSGIFPGYCTPAGGSFTRSLRESFPHISSPSPQIERKLTGLRKLSLENGSLMDGAQLLIPTHLTDITPDWVIMVANQYLAKQGLPLIHRKSCKVLNFDVSNCKKGVGDLSSTCSIHLTLKCEPDSQGDVTPHTSEIRNFRFVAKFLPLDDSLRIYVFETDVFRKESLVNFEVLPAVRSALHFMSLRNRQSRDGGGGCHDFVTQLSDQIASLIPDCVYSSYNSEGVGVLVFRSVSEEGFGHVDRLDGFDLDHMSCIVKNVAKFHAAGRCLLHLRGLDIVRHLYPCLQLDILGNPNLLPEVKAHLNTYQEFLDTVSSYPRGMVTSCRGLPAEVCNEVRCQFKAFISQNQLADLVSGLNRTGNPKLTTIIHGELWEHNVMLHNNDRIKILDWKNAKIASCTVDLAFLMLSSTDYHLRQQSGRHILKVYYDSFVSTCSRLQPAGSSPFTLTFEEFEQDYAESVKFALLQCVIMFVLELQYLDSRLADPNTKQDQVLHEQLASRLKHFEIRAINLFRGIEMFTTDKDQPDRATPDGGTPETALKFSRKQSLEESPVDELEL